MIFIKTYIIRYKKNIAKAVLNPVSVKVRIEKTTPANKINNSQLMQPPDKFFCSSDLDSI